jgi:hypothetical protein
VELKIRLNHNLSKCGVKKARVCPIVMISHLLYPISNERSIFFGKNKQRTFQRIAKTWIY